MAEKKLFKCRNCGERFECVTLSPEEVRQLQREGRNTSAVHCPVCNRTDLVPERR